MSEGTTIFVPAGHAAFIYPVLVSDAVDDDGAQILDSIGHHPGHAHVVDMLDEGEDG